MFPGLTRFLSLYIGLKHGLHKGHTLIAPKLLVGLLGLRGLICCCHKRLTNAVIATAVQGVERLVGGRVLKSLGTHTARSPHYHVLGPSSVCLSPQVSLATEYLASCKYSIEYYFHTVSLEEHHQNNTHDL
jgi:hypothetical protein